MKKKITELTDLELAQAVAVNQQKLVNIQDMVNTLLKELQERLDKEEPKEE